MAEITRQEHLDWKQQKVTKEYLKRLFEKREQLKEGLAEGQSEGGTQFYNVIGQCQAYKDAIDYGLYDFEVISLEEQANNVS